MHAKTTLNMEKTVQISDFISYAVSLLWVKLCYDILLRNVWRAGPGCSNIGLRYPPDKSLSSGLVLGKPIALSTG